MDGSGPFSIPSLRLVATSLSSAVLCAGCIFPEDDLGANTHTTTSGSPHASDGADETGDGGAAAPEPFQHRYFLAEHIEYDGIDASLEATFEVPEQCRGMDQADLLGDLRAEFIEDGWSGEFARDRGRHPEANLFARPEMFVESYAGAPFDEAFAEPSDSMHADAFDLVIYAGAGYHGYLSTNVPADEDPLNECDVEFGRDIRLGAFCGQDAKVAIFASPCAMGFDEELCPRPPEDGDFDGFGPWSWECWNPFICSTVQSSIGHTMSFVDVPIFESGQLATWYGNAKYMTLNNSWLSWMMTEDVSGYVNQPAVLAMGDDYDDFITRFYESEIETGHGLWKMGPNFTDEVEIGVSYVRWDGTTGIVDPLGNDVQFGAQDPESNPNCLPDHNVVCQGMNPEGVSFADCAE